MSMILVLLVVLLPPLQTAAAQTTSTMRPDVDRLVQTAEKHPAPIYATGALSTPSILAATSASSRRSARNTPTRNAAERKNGQNRTSDSVQIEGLTFHRGTQ